MLLRSITRLLLCAFIGVGSPSFAADTPAIRHSYLVMGGKTAIIGEDGKAEWEYTGGTRDGFVLPNGNVLLAFSDHVEEVTREKQIEFTYRIDKVNGEIGTAQRLYNGNTLITELGAKPRLLEVNAKGEIVLVVPNGLDRACTAS